jgi:hypothetical protein
MAVSESTMLDWTGRASNAEQDRYERTRRAIIEAIQASNAWQDANLRTYAKGSYPNFTNVVRDSDVDIAVEMETALFSEFLHQASHLTNADVGLSPYSAAYDWRRLKDDIEAALVQAFGASAVSRGNKALHVRASARGLAADVVPCYTYRAYVTAAGGYRTGIQIHADDGARIANYPQQHLDEGLAKNDATLRRYKRVVRILKRLENQMVRENVSPVVPSFLIESLIWNVGNGAFGENTWRERVRAALMELYGALEDDLLRAALLEANNCKFLLHPDQGWTRQDARDFVLNSWAYIGY